jgi:hypothetical protein
VEKMPNMKEFLKETYNLGDNLEVAQIIFKAGLCGVLKETGMIEDIALNLSLDRDIYQYTRPFLAEKLLLKLSEDLSPKGKLPGSGIFDKRPIRMAYLNKQTSNI